MEENNSKKRCSSIETRAKILNTADRLFYEKGIKSVGIDTIIAESGVAKMSLYKHFPSKEALVVEYLNQRDIKYFELISQYLDNTESKNPILDYIYFMKDILNDNAYNHCPFINTIMEYPDPENLIHITIVEHKKKIKDKLIETLKRIKIKNPEKIAEKISLLLHGAIINKQIFGKDYNIDVFIDSIEEIFNKK